MGDVIEGVLAGRTRSTRQDRAELLLRRAGVCVLIAVVVLALCNVFGQRASTATTSTGAATLSVRVPHAVRPGLLYQGRIAITARAAMPKVELVLSHGWFDGMTMNTGEPSASTETSGPDGSIVFSIGALKAGQTFVEYLEYQVNPTSSGSRELAVSVTSAGTPVVSLHRGMTIYP